MYFPGSTLEQIAALQQRVSNLEGQNAFQNQKPQTQAAAADQNEYQNLTGVQTASMGSPYTAASLQELYAKGTSGVGQTGGGLKKSEPFFTLVFVSPAKANSRVDADHFHFEAGFVVFSKYGNYVSAYPASEIDHIRQ